MLCYCIGYFSNILFSNYNLPYICLTEFYADFFTYPFVILAHTKDAPKHLLPAIYINISSAFSLILALLSPNLLNN
jgi:hypothetical protein